VDFLADVFGYDKFSEVTSEYAIRSNYCDLALKIDGIGKPKLLIECKQAGGDLKDVHVKQAVNYATQEGISWVVLTNAVSWRVYHLKFGKPVKDELIYSFEFGGLNIKNEAHLDYVFALSRESLVKKTTGLDEMYEHLSIVNPCVVGLLLLDDSTVNNVKKLIKRLSPGVKIDNADVLKMLENDVIKRAILDDDEVKRLRANIKRKLSKPAKK
jgi:hypothetical protein